MPDSVPLRRAEARRAAAPTRRRLGATAMLVWLALAAGCAKREPPSGGPPDLDPPRVISVSPDSGSAGVPLDARLSLVFSENMEPRSTGDAVSLLPRVDVKRRSWRGRTLTLTLADSLRPQQTYTLSVGGFARDAHGNPMGRGVTVAFSTGERFPPGRLEGEIEGRGLPAAGVAIWCYDAARHHEPDSTAQDFDALGFADGDGRFRVDGLPVPAHYRLWAFSDLNGNRSFEPGTDVLSGIDTTFALTEASPIASGLRVVVINPRAPGAVRGAVLDSLGDSLGVLRLIAQSERDSTRRHVVDIDPSGIFDLQLEAGPWILRAFRDLDRSRSWQAGRENASQPLRIDLPPAGEIGELKLVLRRETGGP